MLITDSFLGKIKLLCLSATESCINSEEKIIITNSWETQVKSVELSILFLPESTEGVAVGATTAMDYENPADSTENDAETVIK